MASAWLISSGKEGLAALEAQPESHEAEYRSVTMVRRREGMLNMLVIASA